MAVSHEQLISMKKKKVMDGRAPYLPQEIITNILKRLPVKSLIRFQCVCNEWKNHIKTPPFIEEHLSYSTKQRDFLLLNSNSNEGDRIGHLCLINRDIEVTKYQKFPYSVASDFIAGSCNGLLCLRCLHSEFFTLWNPATREILGVPQLKLQVEPQCFRSWLVGFGFSPIVNDYKIVRLSFTRMKLDLKVSIVEVFSLRTRSWKVVEAGETNVINVTPHVRTGLTFDGAIFWFGHRIKPGPVMEPEFCLISFDIATESLTLIPIPRHVSLCKGLTVFANKLALFCDSGMFNRSIGSTIPFSINLWVTEKCIDGLGERWIWTHMYSHIYTRSACFSSPLTIWRNQLFWKPCASPLFVENAQARADKVENKLVSCNLHFNELKMLTIGKYPFATDIWSYAESLVSLGNIHMEASSS